MRIVRSLSWLVVPFALVVSPALADEVVYFTNGTYLLVTSHTIEKEMISVDLGGSSKMAFPLQMVDKIESAGRNVYLNPTYHPANQAVAGPAAGGMVSNGGVYPVTGAGSVPSRLRSPHPTGGTGVPLNGGLDAQQLAGYNPGGYRFAPEGEDVADRAAAEMKALQGGVPLPQPPQSLQGPAGRKASLVRVSMRAAAAPVPGSPADAQGGTTTGQGGNTGQTPTGDPSNSNNNSNTGNPPPGN